MWKKIADITFFELIKYENTENKMISWKTNDDIIRICSFDNMEEVQDPSPVLNIKFTIWEKV